VAVSLSQRDGPALRPEYPPVHPARPYRLSSVDLLAGVRQARQELAQTSA
jgi:hypothetical protein